MNSVAGAVRFERGFKIKSRYWEPRFVGITREERDGKAYHNHVIVMPHIGRTGIGLNRMYKMGRAAAESL